MGSDGSWGHERPPEAGRTNPARPVRPAQCRRPRRRLAIGASPGKKSARHRASPGLHRPGCFQNREFSARNITNVSGGDGSDIGSFESGSPQLNIQRLTSSVVLSWPAYYGGFTLESVTNLSALNNWSTVSGTPVVVGVQFNVTNASASGNKFFRLRGY